MSQPEALQSGATRRYRARYEIKYLVPMDVRVALMHDLRRSFEYDRHSAGGNPHYRVRSLYFETPMRTSYSEKLDGLSRRLKFRIRTYAENESDAPRFLEVKERCNRQILKRKTRLTEADCQALVSGRSPSALVSNEVMQEFWIHRARSSLQPLVLIDYLRQALWMRGNDRVRVTFDTGVTAAWARSLDVSSHRSRPIFSRGQSILEIKFDDVLPRYLHRLIQKYSLQDLAISKFCLGLDALARVGIIGDL
jgi:SPX domain protein involved in polyphosphate accumulation